MKSVPNNLEDDNTDPTYYAEYTVGVCIRPEKLGSKDQRFVGKQCEKLLVNLQSKNRKHTCVVDDLFPNVNISLD